jgi:hypothetical protein
MKHARATSMTRSSVVLALLASLWLPPGLRPARADELGTISGTVLDKGSGDPVIEAGVEVVGAGSTVRTDLDGRYTVKVPPGTYQLRIFAPLYQGARLTNVVVRPNAVTRADAALAASGTAGVEVVEVVAQAKKATEATQLLKRQTSAVVSDNVSAETIQKTPDSDVAEVVERVPAVTVKDGRYVYVRGLGERYSSALVDGSRLPSPDPDKRVVPLDIFPAEFLSALSIVKSHTPDLPGDFSGGLVDIELVEFPDRPTFGLAASSGANTASTFRPFQSFGGVPNKYLGFSAGALELPSSFPADDLGTPPVAEQRRLASDLPNIWTPHDIQAAPDTGLSVRGGNTWGPFGLELGGVYDTDYRQHRREVERQFTNVNTVEEPVISQVDDFLYRRSTFETELGGVLASGYKLSDDHLLTFRGLIDHTSAQQVLTGDGTTTQNPDDTTLTSQLQYTQEQLAFGQLAGQHRLVPHLDVGWRTALAETTQEIPDTRNLTYIGPPGGPFAFTNDGTGGLRLFSKLRDHMSDSAVDFTVPFTTGLPYTDRWSGLPAKLKFGPAYTYRTRRYRLRRFRYRRTGSIDPTLPPDELLAPSNIGNGITFEEETQPRDSFDASEEILGGYAMIDLPLVRDRLRLITGVRVEDWNLVLDTFDDQGNPVEPRKMEVNPLPSVNLVYSLRSDMNVRFSYGWSVSRPEFRELSPTLYPEPVGLRPVVGNPDLVQSTITNYDLRWEWFLSGSEVVSVGGFYKQIERPIEQVVVVGASDLRDSFENADRATLRGFEVEGRKSFGFLAPRLAPLSLVANVAYVSSTVTVPRRSTFAVQTSTSRALQGQAPFVVNAAIDYAPSWAEFQLLYGTAGRVISDAGAFGLPDIFLERRSELDATVIVPLQPLGLPARAKFAVENILNAPYTYTQGGRLQEKYTAGTSFSFGVSYSF